MITYDEHRVLPHDVQCSWALFHAGETTDIAHRRKVERERERGNAMSSGADRAFNSLSNGTNHVSIRQTDAELVERQWTRNR